METDYTYNESTLLASILYLAKQDFSYPKKIFKYIADNMLFNKQAKQTYQIIKYLCSGEDMELIGTNHFVTKVRKIAQIEHPGLENYIDELGQYYTDSTSINYWIKKIHKFYFDYCYKQAETKEQFQAVIKEEGEYSLDVDMVNMSDDVDFVMQNYNKVKNTAVFTSYPSINNVLGSFQGGDFVVLAGASSSGKTCMMLNLMIGMAKAGKKIDVFSLEMPRYKLQQRIICAETEIIASKFKSFSLSEEDLNKFNNYAHNEFKKLNIRIYKQQTINIEYIKTIVMKSDADIVFIDYLGLIGGYGNKSSYERFSDISRELKLLAMASNKPLIVLHQLNREFQNRDDKKPKTSDLRDSGKIEQDADMICFVYRPSQFDPNEPKEKLIFNVAKNRDGEANKDVDLIFNGMYQKILEPMKL